MIYGYARVSTIGQGREGNSLESQMAALEQYGCEKIYTEAYTGKTMDRPQFKELISALQKGDTFVVCKLDRFARTAIEGVQTIQNLFNRGVNVEILNMGRVDNTLTGKLVLTIMLAFAEYERGMIVERTQNGKAIAKQNPNYREGRPRKYSNQQIDHALSLLYNGKTYKEVEGMTGISKSSLKRYKSKYIFIKNKRSLS